jgi:hypothetical protein
VLSFVTLIKVSQLFPYMSLEIYVGQEYKKPIPCDLGLLNP